MFARTTTVRGDPAAIDAAVDYVRDEVLPAVEPMAGCVGLSLLTNHRNGRCVLTSAWDSEGALQASAEGTRSFRARFGELLDAVPMVATWEIAVMHRVRPAGEGACCRVVRGALHEPASMDDVLGTVRTSLLPRLEELPGFCSVSFLVDRLSGRTTTTVTYADRAAMARAVDPGGALREEFSRASRTTVQEVSEYALSVAHLRVPETV
ncbi:antibiotic biosynthesis monooxygenase [Modestobacter sp. SYSU DS0657]